MSLEIYFTIAYYSCKIKRVSAWLGVWNPSKSHQQWPMAKCQSQDGKTFETELPISLVSLASMLAMFFLVGSECVRGFRPIDINWRFMISWKDDMHTSWPGWCLCPFAADDINMRKIYVEAVEAISSTYDSTHQFWDELETCQLQKGLCYEPCREIAANRFSRAQQRKTYCFHNHVGLLVLRPPV